jgi:hypothetical protein
MKQPPFSTWLSYWGLLVAWLMMAPVRAQAPRTVQVVTRTVSQTLECPTGTVVRIRADRATVRVQGWDQHMLRVVLRLSARHPERAVAEKDLPTAQYHFSQQAGAIDLVNYQTLAAGAPAPSSDLRADYTIFMPAANALQVANTYGQTQLTGLTGRQKLTQEFGQVELRQLRGSFDAIVRYADLVGSDLQLVFTCQAEKSALVLKSIAGGYAIRNRYGSIRLEPTAELTGVNIDAERTEISVLPPPFTQFNYQLTASHGALSLPTTYPDATGNRTSWRSPGAERRPLIRIITTYASLTLLPSAGALLSHP